MCGVIYFKGDSEKHKELLLNILKESQVRGLHAFGVAVREEKDEQFTVVRYFDLRGAIKFIERNEFYELIGHCRYDTSGDWHTLGNNQPVVVGQNLLAFNGVVRMSTKDEYQEEFQREYTNDNDGEIPLRMFAEGNITAALSLLGEKRVSFSGVVHVNGHTMAIRNERRPLWEAVTNGSRWIFSTMDIWRRAILEIHLHSSGYQPEQVREISPLETVWLS